MTVLLWFSATLQSRSCSTSGSITEKPRLNPGRTPTQQNPDQDKVKAGSESARPKSDPRSALGHTAVPFPPWLGQTLHLVRRLPLLFLSFLFPSRELLGAVVLQTGQYGCVKHFFKVLLGQRGALHVGHRSDLHGTVPGVRWLDGPLPIPRQVDENLNTRGNTFMIDPKLGNSKYSF